MSKSLKKIFFRRLNLLVFGATLLLALLLVQAERMILLGDLHNKGESIARILGAVTLDAVMAHDYATVERYVADIVNDQAINAVSITRADGEILASAGEHETSAEVIVTTNVFLGQYSFAEVSISLSRKRVQIISRNLLLATVVVAFIFHLLGLLTSSIALKRAVILPLAKLNTCIKALQDGDYGQQVVITEPLEFMTIGNSLNEMAITIRSNFENIRKHQEKSQLEQNKLAAIVNSMADGLFVTDDKGIIISFNRSATAITGFPEGEAIGMQCCELFRTKLCKEACAVENEGKIIQNRETTLKNRAGQLLNVSVSSAILYDSKGKAAGGVQTFRDITEDKKRQEMYCHTEKLAAVGQLAAGVAHEINNPLSNILGYSRKIKLQTEPAELEHLVSVIVEQTRKCGDIVKGLLNFSRSSGSNPRIFNINGLIESVIEILAYQAKKKRTIIHFSPIEDFSVYADPAKIEQVLFNLLINGLQAVSDNGNIRVTTGIAGSNVYFTVADDGPGIPADQRQRVFEPFFTTKPVGTGTGLGLSICAGIIAEADGAIDVAASDEGGSLFTVLLPAGEPAKKEMG